MQLNLSPHPTTQPSDPRFDVWVRVEYAGAFGATATLNLWFGVSAPMSRFVVAEPMEEPRRADELWRTTCFEAFLAEAGASGYREWNFAPSGDWAAYDFSAYRESLGNAPVTAAPYVRLEDNLTWWGVGATLTVEAGVEWRLGLSAVLEEKDGAKSYWALAHGGQKPDFHNPGCFTAKLA